MTCLSFCSYGLAAWRELVYVPSYSEHTDSCWCVAKQHFCIYVFVYTYTYNIYISICAQLGILGMCLDICCVNHIIGSVYIHAGISMYMYLVYVYRYR